MHHYTSLRRAALNCLVGKWHNASPYIACCFLSKFMIDPLLHTILQCLRILRRSASVQVELAKESIREALDWTGSRPFGPATALRQYLKQVGWHLTLDGTVSGPDYMSFNILTDSCRRIAKIAKQMWSYHILDMIDRKGVGDFFPDVATFHGCFHKLCDEDSGSVEIECCWSLPDSSTKSQMGWVKCLTNVNFAVSQIHESIACLNVHL